MEREKEGVEVCVRRVKMCGGKCEYSEQGCAGVYFAFISGGVWRGGSNRGARLSPVQGKYRPINYEYIRF